MVRRFFVDEAAGRLDCRMTSKPSGAFDEGFLIAIHALVNIHHSIYPTVPPQGIYFEALVEQAFKRIKKPYTIVAGTSRNSAGHDLLVEDMRMSLKTETGLGTKSDRITITKLCTTEREPWDAPTLVGRVLEHLSRYDIIFMLRALWRLPLIHYQLLEISIGSLAAMGDATFEPVGHRKGRHSIGAERASSLISTIRHFASTSMARMANARSGVSPEQPARCFRSGMLQEWDVKVVD